jgi:hypothetical protein
LRQLIEDAQAVAVHGGFVTFDGVCAQGDWRENGAFRGECNTFGRAAHERFLDFRKDSGRSDA